MVPRLPSIAIDPSLVADKDDKLPRNPPIGVRATPTMQTSIQPNVECLKREEKTNPSQKYNNNGCLTSI